MQSFKKLHGYPTIILIVTCALLSTSEKMLVGTTGITILIASTLLPLHISLSIILFLSGVIPQSSTVDKLFLVFEKVSFCELALTGILLRLLCETTISHTSFSIKKTQLVNFLKIFFFFLLFFLIGAAKNGLNNSIIDVRPFYLYLTILPAIYSAKNNSEKTLSWFIATLTAASVVICAEFILINRLKSYIPYEYMPDLHDDNRVSLRNGGFFIFSFGILAYLVKSKSSTLVEKIIFLITLLLIFSASFLAQNRTNIATYIIEVMAVHLLGKKITFKRLASTGMKAITAVLSIYMLSLMFQNSVFSEVVNRFLLALNPEENTDTLIARTSMIAAAWARFTDSPLIGMGLGSQFDIVLLEYDLGTNYYIDNLWVVLLCKFGLIGFIPLTLFVYRSIASNSLRVSFSNPNTQRNIKVYHLYAIVLIGELMMSLTTAMLWVHVASIIPFSIATGILLNQQREWYGTQV